MEFLLIASAHFLALLSPGPDFFLIMRASLRLPLRFGVAICAGIAAANGVYLFCAVLGLEMIRELSWLFIVLKYLGAAYLVVLGVMLLKTPRQNFTDHTDHNFIQVHDLRHQFLIGFISAILNPKNAIFYLSLFTVMVSEQTSFLVRCLYALWMMSIVFIWDCFVLIALGNRKLKNRLGGGVYYVEKISGAAISSFGLVLPFV
ncbi:MAG: LysE family transporter [Desulfocapsaceae bacterium]|nr:LysE family transporter [Desulfocapsaceae bacterium]